MKTNIKFGTDGWRGVIADDFTFENVELPMDMDILENKRREVSDKITAVAERITELQKQIDKLVMKLYGISEASV